MIGNKKILYPILTVILTITIFITGCNQNTNPTSVITEPTQTSPQSIRDITVTEAFDLIKENKDNPNFIIIDIRTPEEYETGYIENAILIDYYAENFREELGKLDRNKTYLEYCRTARRSGLALEIFKELGFKDVLNMAGGITEWIAQGLPVVR